MIRTTCRFQTVVLLESLQGLKPLFDGLRKISGAPGLAVGVIHDGKILYEDYSGYRDVERKLEVDRNTIFLVASLTKAMTAAAVGILVDEGTLEWTTPVHDILPEMSRSSSLRDAKLNVIDLLSHRSGVAWYDARYLQSNNNIIMPREKCIRTFESIPIIAPIRSLFMYNNHAFNIVGLVIEKLAGKNWGDFVREKLFQPLNMTRTYTQEPEDSNIALPYNILTDKTAFRIPQSEISDKTAMFAGASVRSSMADLLKLYQSYLHAIQQLDLPDKSKSTAVSKQIEEIVRPQIATSSDSLREQTYALAWMRTQLPGKLDFAWNSKVVDPFPILGINAPKKLAIWHGGNFPGVTAAVCLLPESGTAVVVMQNSLGLCDIADWACEAIVDTLTSGKPQHDYLELARQAATNTAQKMEKVQEQLDKERIRGTTHRSLTSYVGSYRNATGNWVIEICTDRTGKLCLKFQARDDELYVLRHYHDDTFVWNLSYDELVKRVQFIRAYPYYKIGFESRASKKGASIDCLRWRHDESVPEGEVFTKVV